MPSFPRKPSFGPIAFLLFAAAGGGQPAFAQDGNIEHGRQLAGICAECHSIDATGPSKLETAPPFRTLGARYPVEELEEALAEGIVTGHPDMPEVTWDPDEIADFIAWLSSIQQ